MTRHGFKFRTIDSGMTMSKKGEALEAFQAALRDEGMAALLGRSNVVPFKR